MNMEIVNLIQVNPPNRHMRISSSCRAHKRNGPSVTCNARAGMSSCKPPNSEPALSSRSSDLVENCASPVRNENARIRQSCPAAKRKDSEGSVVIPLKQGIKTMLA